MGVLALGRLKTHPEKKTRKNPPSQWLFLVPLKGGRDYIIPQVRQCISGSPKWYDIPANWGMGNLPPTYHPFCWEPASQPLTVLQICLHGR